MLRGKREREKENLTFKTLYLEKQFENHCETIANIRVENKPPKDINGVPSLTPHFSLNREGEGEGEKNKEREGEGVSAWMGAKWRSGQ